MENYIREKNIYITIIFKSSVPNEMKYINGKGRFCNETNFTGIKVAQNVFIINKEIRK